jgi:hypothetical protein
VLEGEIGGRGERRETTDLLKEYLRDKKREN